MLTDNAAGARKSLHGNWSSRLAFVLAVTGSAVGLGNIWKFPYIAGQNGGGAFVLVYLACVVIIGMPVMMSEILMGRRGRRNPIATMRLLGEEEGGSRHWQLIGAMGVLAGVLILSYYGVIAGWVVAYIPKSISGVFANASAADIRGRLFTGSIVSPPPTCTCTSVRTRPRPRNFSCRAEGRPECRSGAPTLQAFFIKK